MAFHRHLNLKPNEHVFMVVRRFPLTDLWSYLIAAIIIIVAFFFLFPLFILGFVGISIFVALVGLSLFIIGRRLFLWYHNAFIITDQRIIDFDQRGFFERVVSESTFEKIQDVSFRFHGFWQTFFHYGDVNVQTAWGSVNLRIPSVLWPERVQRLILDVHKQYMNDGEYGSSHQAREKDQDAKRSERI